MTITEFIAKQEPGRQDVLNAIHTAILKEDKTVDATIGPMMGKEMILYKEKGYFKYGLASVKNYMSVHAMPIYMNAPLHGKYQKLLPGAEFQKGCMNFKTGADVPLPVIHQFFADCSKVSIADMLEKRSRSKKK